MVPSCTAPSTLKTRDLLTCLSSIHNSQIVAFRGDNAFAASNILIFRAANTAGAPSEHLRSLAVSQQISWTNKQSNSEYRPGSRKSRFSTSRGLEVSQSIQPKHRRALAAASRPRARRTGQRTASNICDLATAMLTVPPSLMSPLGIFALYLSSHLSGCAPCARTS